MADFAIPDNLEIPFGRPRPEYCEREMRHVWRKACALRTAVQHLAPALIESAGDGDDIATAQMGGALSAIVAATEFITMADGSPSSLELTENEGREHVPVLWNALVVILALAKKTADKEAERSKAAAIG
jgi:hypothetical protein